VRQDASIDDAAAIADGVMGHLTIVNAKAVLAYVALLLLICGICGVVVHRFITAPPAPVEEQPRAVHD
jgi:hypothetical protein